MEVDMWSRRQRGDGVQHEHVDGKEEVGAVEVVVGSGGGLVPRSERLWYQWKNK